MAACSTQTNEQQHCCHNNTAGVMEASDLGFEAGSVVLSTTARRGPAVRHTNACARSGGPGPGSLLMHSPLFVTSAGALALAAALADGRAPDLIDLDLRDNPQILQSGTAALVGGTGGSCGQSGCWLVCDSARAGCACLQCPCPLSSLPSQCSTGEGKGRKASRLAVSQGRGAIPVS